MTHTAELEMRVEVLEANNDMLHAAFRTVDGEFHDAIVRTRATSSMLGALRTTQIEHDRLLTGLACDVEATRTDVRVLKTDVNVIKTDVHGLKTDVRVLTADVNGLKTDMHEMKADVHGLKTDVRVLTADVNGIKADVHGLKSSVKGFATRFDILEGLMRRAFSLPASEG